MPWQNSGDEMKVVKFPQEIIKEKHIRTAEERFLDAIEVYSQVKSENNLQRVYTTIRDWFTEKNS